MDGGKDAGDGGHQRIRHGNRQARRPLRGALRALRFAGGVLSGGRAGRKGRPSFLCRAHRRFRRPGAFDTPFLLRISHHSADKGYLCPVDELSRGGHRGGEILLDGGEPVRFLCP